MFLVENQGFTWSGEVRNGLGTTFPYPITTDGIHLPPVKEPHKEQVVLYYDKDTKKLQFVLIESGSFLSDGRISNFWSWYELNENNGKIEVGELKSGYGNFYKAPFEFEVRKVYAVNIKKISVSHKTPFLSEGGFFIVSLTYDRIND